MNGGEMSRRVVALAGASGVTVAFEPKARTS